jgi:hypothetical protein
MRRTALTAAALAVLTLPALAAAQPTAFRLQATVAPGDQASLTIGAFPRGEFRIRLQASSDDVKRFTLTQQGIGRRAFVVLRSPGPLVGRACEGAAGSLICTGLTTPVTPGGKAWRLTVGNESGRPTTFTLSVSFRRVGSAG